MDRVAARNSRDENTNDLREMKLRRLTG
jgi:hypothetical protein